MHDSPVTRSPIAPPAPAGIRRAADLRLRGRGGPIPVRVRWPASQALGSPPPVIVVLADPSGTSAAGPADDTLCDELCAGLGALVLRTAWAARRDDAPGSALERAAGALEWAADHAAELDGDPERLIVAGRGRAAAAAGALSLRARDQGWPRLAGQVLVLTGPCPAEADAPPPAGARRGSGGRHDRHPARRHPLLAAPAGRGRGGQRARRSARGPRRVPRAALPLRAHRTPAGVARVNEAELIEAARAGDGHAFAELLAPYRGALQAHCRGMLRSEHDGEDALQEVMLRAWRALPGFEGRSSLRSWLYRIATNTCLNEIDRRGRRPSTSEEEPPDDAHEPDERESLTEALTVAHERLSAGQRAALLLRDGLGFTAGESAVLLGTTTRVGQQRAPAGPGLDRRPAARAAAGPAHAGGRQALPRGRRARRHRRVRRAAARGRRPPGGGTGLTPRPGAAVRRGRVWQ